MIIKAINFLVYLLRYLTIIHTKYNVSNKINFGSRLANIFFKKNLKKCKFYLEYGSGNSTILAHELDKKFQSIETDKSFYKFMKTKKIQNIVYSDLGPTKYFSFPILPLMFIKKKIEFYGNYLDHFYKQKKTIPDLILIDGRFRVFTCINVLNFLSKNKIKKRIKIIIDDYKFRKNYKVLNKIHLVKKLADSEL